jgi:hypothetical protein
MAAEWRGTVVRASDAGASTRTYGQVRQLSRGCSLPKTTYAFVVDNLGDSSKAASVGTVCEEDYPADFNQPPLGGFDINIRHLK